MTSKRKQVTAAAAVTCVNIAVAISVNLLTSSWSWVVFSVLAVLSAVWVGLEAWRAAPKRAVRRSPAAPVLPGGGSFVPRPELTGEVVRLLLSGSARKVGLTTGLAGAGGFGKTTLAAEVCARDDVRAGFTRIDWVTVGQEVRGAALADAINDVSERIDGQRPGLTSPEQAGMRLGELLKEAGGCLLVVDDVWTAEQLRPFLNAGRGCTLLITTRIPDLLPADGKAVVVDQMSGAQARVLATSGVADLPRPLVDQLVDLTGRWPLALGLVNAALRRSARDGGDVVGAAEVLLRRLRDRGPVGLDMTTEALRNRTVAATIESSLGVLGDRRERVVELAIFPEDTDIPLEHVALLWRSTAVLSRDESDRLCQDLVELSLVERRGKDSTLKLHDVIRAYLRHECGDVRLRALHDGFLDVVASTLPEPAHRPAAWWTLPATAEYLWRSLTYHLGGAGRHAELAELVTTPLWVIGKLRGLGPVAVADDLAAADTEMSRELGRFLDRTAHLLVPTTPDHAVVGALAHRLPPSPALSALREAALLEVKDVPRLVPDGVLPDLPHPALDRVLEGHDNRVHHCAFTAGGDQIISVGWADIRVWNADSGRLVRVIENDLDIGFDVTMSPDGRYLAMPDTISGIRLWNTADWRYAALRGHREWINDVSFSADGRTLVSVSDDRTIRVWDTGTGEEVRSFKAPVALDTATVFGDGRLMAEHPDGWQVWDLATGDATVFRGQPSRERRSLSPDGRWAVAPNSDGLLVHDLAEPEEPPRTLHHHAIPAVATFSKDGSLLATGGAGGLLLLWSVASWRVERHITAPQSKITALALSPDGTRLASAGDDGVLRLWHLADAYDGDVGTTRSATAATACVAAVDGSWLAVEREKGRVVVVDPVTKQETADLAHLGTRRGWLHEGDLVALGNGHLAVGTYNGMILCGPDNWRASRTLRDPRESDLTRPSAGRQVVSAQSEDRVLVWTAGRLSQPVILKVEPDQVRVEPVPRPEPVPPAFVRHVRRVGEAVTRPVLGRLKKRNGGIADRMRSTLAPDDRWLAVAVGRTVHVVAPTTGEGIAVLRFDDDVEGVAAVPGGRRLAVLVDDVIHYWSTATWTAEKVFVARDDLGPSTDGMWSPDGSLLAVVGEDRVLRVHDGEDGTCLTRLRLDGELTDCAWLSDDRLVAVGRHGLYWFDYLPGSR
ncbi:NB-ARC domain-containing protein [Saccharothrix luteola]|uniref:NB-ARC domain-containing protein n=1 Tax=Saccharothrix luteola TaxID=2893018 RepID=UPI001E30BBA9|nr:NB-ARC domain-containing protein [Saccharothrix luteola]MCC8246355.1 hypothetical protein [Saccharothrix luteola]